MIDLRQGDCLEVMKDIPDNSIDLICIDPPYIVENHGGTKSGLSKRSAKVRDEIDFISKGFDYEKTFNELIRILKIPNLLIFCSNQQISKTMKWFEDRKYTTTLLVWKKPNPSPLCNGKYVSDLEFIVYVRSKGAKWNNKAEYHKKLKCKEFKNTRNKVHPTEKPVDLLKELIEVHTMENDTVLDCFMGSGTTGVACKNLNRNFIGIELDKQYFEIAKERIENDRN